MSDRLGELWNGWTDGGSSSAALTAGFVVAGLLCIAASVIVSRTAARRRRSGYGWGLLVTLSGTALLAIGLLFPASFHYFAIGGGLVSVLVAILARWLVDRSVSTCHQGHELAPNWVHCPRCAPPKATPAPIAVPAGVGAAPIGGAAAPAFGAAGTIAPPGRAAAPAPAPAPSGPVMIRLIPETSGGKDATVHSGGALIGRNPAADVAVDDSSASWEHARIIERHGSPTVLDLGSSNGTYVNDERVESSLLIAGDRLRVGDTIFRVVT